MSILDNETIILDKNIKELKNVYSDEIFYCMAKAFKKLIANPDPPSTIPGEQPPMNDNANLANYFCTEQSIL